MAHRDAHGFEYDNDVLDAVAEAEMSVQDILDLLDGNPWEPPYCLGYDECTGNSEFCPEGCLVV